MTRPHPPAISTDNLLEGSPTGFLQTNLPRFFAATDLVASLTTQVLSSVAIPLQAGDTVTSLTFLSGATPAGTPTNWWFALYSSAATPALLAQTADQLTAAWAADTTKTLALATVQVIPTTGIYYAAIMVKATTVPTLMGLSVGRAAIAGNVGTLGYKVISQTSGAALTTTAPATIATPTTVATVPWVALS